VVDLHGERARHVLDRHRRPGGLAGGGQRVAHHAVRAAVDHVRHAPRLAGTVERHRHARGVNQRLYLVQAGHPGGVLRVIFERTLMNIVL
jgi:hypothetical protein